jgi:hypothetical protein
LAGAAHTLRRRSPGKHMTTPASDHTMRAVAVVFGSFLIAGVAALAVTLSHSPIGVARLSSPEQVSLGSLRQTTIVCQPDEVLPAETSAVRLSMFAFTGPRVTVELLVGGHMIARGARGPGWTGGSVTVPVNPVAGARRGVTLCFSVFLNGDEDVAVSGQRTGAALAARELGGPWPGRITVEDLRPQRSSWWSLALPVARRMGLGRAASGTWVALLVLALMLAVGAISSLVVLRELHVSRSVSQTARVRHGSRLRVSRLLGSTIRRVPSAAWLCAAVACVNAIAWSVITPPFQVPDEPSHVAYVKELAEGRLPAHGEPLSSAERLALLGVHLQRVAEHPQRQTISSRAQQQTLERDLAVAGQEPTGGGDGGGVAASQPPLYYALEVIPYSIGAGGTLLDRIELMRLLSALMGGLTALFAFMFVRELLPRLRWAWAVGGLGVALAPLLGFMSGAVNPDAMLFAVSAVLFYCLARGFRRGLTRRGAICIGTVVAIGFATKLNFVGLAPGALLGLVVLSVRSARSLGRSVYVSLAVALAVAVAPPLVYVLAHVASGASTLGIVSSAFALKRGTVWDEASYIWQLYLPRLPWIQADFAGLSSTRELWFNRYVGLYGWLDTTFPGWVYDLALVPALAIAGSCLRAIVASSSALRARAPELAVYCVMSVGLLVLIGADSYIGFPKSEAEYAQARYLLPLLPLLAAVLALGARGAGRRCGPPAGAAIIALFLLHDLFSQLQVVARFYG